MTLLQSAGLAVASCVLGCAVTGNPSAAPSSAIVTNGIGTPDVTPGSELTLDNAVPLPNETGPTSVALGDVGGQSNAYQIIEQITPDDPTALSFLETLTSKFFPADLTRPDWTLTQGWNLTANGTRLNTTDAALATQYESYWAMDATHHWLEYHLIGLDTSGIEYRPLSFQFSRDGSATTGYISADNFNIADRNAFNGGTTYFTFGSTPEPSGVGYLYLQANATIRAGINNAIWLTQANAENTHLLSLAYLDDNDAVEIGVGGTAGGNATGVVLGAASSSTRVSGALTVAGAASFSSPVIAAAGVAPTSPSPAPACTSSNRGAIYVAQGGSGVTDTVEVCLKSAAGSYSWVAVATGG